MAETQKGFRLHRWSEDPVLEEFPRTEPLPGQVTVSVEACGVGLTVLNWSRGDVSNDPSLLPRVPGHEVVGRVVAAGSPTDEHLVGKRTIFHAYLFCGVCRGCLAGNPSRCSDVRGWIGLHLDGGYAPFTVLPARNAIVVDDDLDPVSATVVPDAVSTGVHVSRTRAQVSPEDRVVVIGAGGGVGIHLIQVASAFGGQVTGFDIGDQKLEAIEALGIPAIDSSDIKGVAPDRIWREGKPTVVVDLVGSAATMAWTQEALGLGGRHIVLTTFRDRSLVIDPRTLTLNEISVVGSRTASLLEYQIAADLVARGDVQAVLGKVSGPEGVLSIHRLLEQGSLIGRGALVWEPSLLPLDD